MKRALVLGAHLDDSVIAMGGTIAKLVKAGIRVDVFCFGNGDEAYTVPGDSDNAVRRFTRDAVKAHEILGCASFECYNVPDFAVMANREFYQQCIRVIRQYKPDIIFSHWWNEYFQHHGMATLSRDAWNQAGWACSADFGTEPHQAEKFYHFEVNDPLPDPSCIVDITDTFETKMAAWMCFEDAHDHLGELDSALEARARYHGSRINVKYGEPFRQDFYIPGAVKNVDKLF